MDADMRMLDAERKHAVRWLQLYITPSQATALRDELTRLLADPEGREHIHVSADDMSRDLSCSIVTKRKLRDAHYTALERAVLEV